MSDALVLVTGRHGRQGALPSDGGEVAPAAGPDRPSAGVLLPATDRDVDVARLELHGMGPPARALGRDQRGTPAEEGVEHPAAPPRGVEQEIDNQLHRLDGRVQAQFLETASPQGVGTRVAPDVGPVPAVAAELDVVGVRGGAALEYQDQLMLR